MSFQDRANQSISQLDKEALNDLEKQTNVPKVYVVIGLASLYFLLIFFNIGGNFLVNTAGFILPAYYSLDAIFSVNKADDTQWLTYWVVYAFLTVLESAINAPYWFPFYYTFKFVLVLWMSLPRTSGALTIFRSLIQPVFGRYFLAKNAAGAAASTASGLKAQAEKSL